MIDKRGRRTAHKSMYHWMSTIAAVTAAMVSVASDAVPVAAQQSHLTDNEIRASYCFGYFKEQFEEGKQLLRCQGDAAAVTACFKQAFGQNQTPEDKMKRTLLYLAAKGIMFGNNDAPLAIVQGGQDFKTCAAAVVTSGDSCYRQNFSACQARIPPLKKGANAVDVTNRANAVQQCLAEQCVSPMCRKASTCESMDFLPY